MNMGVPWKGSKRAPMGQSSYFAHKNILFGIFPPGAAPAARRCACFFHHMPSLVIVVGSDGKLVSILERPYVTFLVCVCFKITRHEYEMWFKLDQIWYYAVEPDKHIIAILTQYREFSPRSRNESGHTSRPVGPTKEVQPRFISTFISGQRADFPVLSPYCLVCHLCALMLLANQSHLSFRP